MKKILIHDANNACWRLMKIMPVLTANGKPIQIVYGFLRLLRSSIEEFNPNVVLVCWDSGRSKFRQELFKEYKANRNHGFRANWVRGKKIVEDKELAAEYNSFMKQAETLKQTLEFLNICQLDYPDSEADDLIAIACDELQGKKIIVSSDLDMLQLIDSETEVWSPIKKELFTLISMRKNMGLTPSQYLQVRAMTGDGSDNIPGAAKGFGEITATELVKQYGGVEILFSSTVEKRVMKKGNRYSLLYSEGAKNRVFRNLMLMDLKVVAAHNPNYKKICEMLHKNIKDRSPVSHGRCHKYFSDQKFESLMKEGLGVWLSPFETLDV